MSEVPCSAAKAAPLEGGYSKIRSSTARPVVFRTICIDPLYSFYGVVSLVFEQPLYQ